MLTYDDLHENPSCLKSVYFQAQCNNSCSPLQEWEQLCCTVNIPEKDWKSKSYQNSVLTQHSSTCPLDNGLSPDRIESTIQAANNCTTKLDTFSPGPWEGLKKKVPKSVIKVQFLRQSWSWQHTSHRDWLQPRETNVCWISSPSGIRIKHGWIQFLFGKHYNTLNFSVEHLNWNK